ncbi:MAG: dusC [Parachlamydiales bacterium]|nr:dusC [Parachlamydiales bacterium]
MSKPVLPKDGNGCPYLQLAPMEGVGDPAFRKTMAAVGGFDEAVTAFIRVPENAHVQSLAKRYQSNEIAPIPLAAQIMGSDPDLMAAMGQELAQRGALRIDVNCGCPSNIVNRRGAGSVLLKNPDLLFKVVNAVVKAVAIPVTIKMRSGFDDTSLFFENLSAAAASGIQYITLHPRTKSDGYRRPARWDLIAAAKEFLKIPVVGNGDIRNVADALKMLQNTGCDGLMIGRGIVMNPFLFLQIRSHFSGTAFQPVWEDLIRYFRVYISKLADDLSPKQRVNKVKQLLALYCNSSEHLLHKRPEILAAQHTDPDEFFAFVQTCLNVYESGANRD